MCIAFLMNECNDIPLLMSVSEHSSLQCAPIPMVVINMCCLVNKSPQPCNTIRRTRFMSNSPLSTTSHSCFTTSFPFLHPTRQLQQHTAGCGILTKFICKCIGRKGRHTRCRSCMNILDLCANERVSGDRGEKRSGGTCKRVGVMRTHCDSFRVSV